MNPTRPTSTQPAQTLLYREHVIATINDSQADFPTFWGKIDLSPMDPSTPELIGDYIEWSIFAFAKIESDTYTDEDAAIEEKKFKTLIYASDWWLESADKRKIPILTPCFQSKTEASWRLDPNRSVS